MGLTNVTTKLTSLMKPQKSFGSLFLVDTGATDSMALCEQLATAGRVIFAPPGTEPLLGVTALGSVRITVDPANKTLKRLPAIPLK